MERPSEFVSQITNFPLLSPEENETGVSVLISKFFKFGRSTAGDNNSVTAKTTPEESQDEENTGGGPAPEDSTNKEAGTSSQYSDEFSEGRSLQKVLKTISSLVALRTSVCNINTTHLSKIGYHNFVCKQNLCMRAFK